jgi:hypothetical protein
VKRAALVALLTACSVVDKTSARLDDAATADRSAVETALTAPADTRGTPDAPPLEAPTDVFDAPPDIEAPDTRDATTGLDAAPHPVRCELDGKTWPAMPKMYACGDGVAPVPPDVRIGWTGVDSTGQGCTSATCSAPFVPCAEGALCTVSLGLTSLLGVCHY